VRFDAALLGFAAGAIPLGPGLQVDPRPLGPMSDFARSTVPSTTVELAGGEAVSSTFGKCGAEGAAVHVIVAADGR
jgi:hypothetical protein